MLLGSHFAGIAIEQSMLGAAHACANPLSARFGIDHGIAVSVMLPAVIRFNSEVVNGSYAELLDAANISYDSDSPGERLVFVLLNFVQPEHYRKIFVNSELRQTAFQNLRMMHPINGQANSTHELLLNQTL